MLGLEEGALVFVVGDSGGGFDAATIEEGEGMQIMRDRMAALGGDLTIESEPGRGTTVVGRISARALERTA